MVILNVKKQLIVLVVVLYHNKIYNIGNKNSAKLEKFISTLEDKFGKKTNKAYMDMQLGDVL